MVTMQATPPSLPADLFTASEPPAVVWKADETFLRYIGDWSELNIGRQLEHITSLVSEELSRWFREPQTPRVEVISQRTLIERLRDMGEGLSNSALRERFLNPTISERELIEVLRYVDVNQRLDFCRELILRAQSEPEAREFCTSKLNNVLAITSFDERLDILRYTLEHRPDSGAETILSEILSASPTNQYLHSMVQSVGEERLLITRFPQVRELVALSSLSQNLCSQMEMRSNSLVGSAGEGVVLTLENVRNILIAARGEVLGSPFNDTQVAQDYLRTIAYNLDYLEKRESGNSSEVDCGDLAHFMLEKLAVEFQFGVTLTHEDPGPRVEVGTEGIEITMSSGAHWTLEEVRQARAALASLPEGLVGMTSALREIQRVEDLGPGVLAQRFPDGAIRLSNYAVNHPVIELLYPGKSSLQVTLVHEIGHGVQLGVGGAGMMESEENQFTIAPGDLTYDFGEYMEVSGWELISPDRFEVIEHGLAVQLDGEDVPVGVPILHDGKAMVLVFNQGFLFAYRAYAPFSLIRYSRTNPWEDWAEAFCDYFLEPERLIRFAPQKYQFLEQEFHHYEGREDLERLLSVRIERSQSKVAAARTDGAKEASNSVIGSMQSLCPE